MAYFLVTGINPLTKGLLRVYLGVFMDERELLNDAIACSSHFIKNYQGKDHRNLSWEFFRTLTELSETILEDEVDVEDVRFTPDEIYKHMADRVHVKPQSDISGWVRSRYKELLKKPLQQVEGNLKSVALEKDLKAYPTVEVDSTLGGRNNKSTYFIKPVLLSEENSTLEREALEYEIPEGGLRYQEEQSKLPFYSQWLSNLDLTGWKRWIWVFLMLFPLVIFVMLGFVPLLFNVTTDWVNELAHFTVYGLLFLLCVGLLFHPFYRVLNNRVVRLPDWMSITSFDNVLLELRTIKNEDDSFKHKNLSLVTYSGKCPICRGRVSIHGGGLQFKGRLIGKCAESPVEHVFSFDHVTRTGRYLR